MLFVEKEGFNEIIRAAKIAERFDIAIMSTKGMSPTAARHLVEELSKNDVRIFVLHDFDKAGISILNTLKTNTWRYKFDVTPNVIDLGLRLTDVKEMNLESEEVLYNTNKDPRENLRKNGATEEECNFLVKSKEGSKLWKGHRVELNAMTSDKFVDFIERKLKENGVEKVVPNEDDLKKAYDRAIKLIKIDKEIEKVKKNISTDEKYPENLSELVSEKLKDYSKAWDDVVYDIARENLNETNQ